MSLYNLYPSNLGSIIAVSAATGLGINTFNIDDSQFVSGNDTTLVQMKSIKLFCLSFVHERLCDSCAVVDNSVSLVLDGHFLLLGQTLKVSDVQVSLVNSLLGTVLPDVGTKNLSAGSEDDVRGSVVRLQLLSSVLIDSHTNFLSLERIKISFKGFIEVVKYCFSYFLCINDFVRVSTALNFENTSVMLLSTRSRVDCRLIQNNYIWFSIFKHILKHFNNCCVKVKHFVIIIENHLGLRQVRGVVKDFCWFLCNSLLSL